MVTGTATSALTARSRRGRGARRRCRRRRRRPTRRTRRMVPARSCSARAAPGAISSSRMRQGAALRTDLEQRAAEAHARAGPRRHRPVAERDVAAGALGRHRCTQPLGGLGELVERLHAHVAVPGAVVAVADQARSRLGVHPLDGAHRQPPPLGDVDRGDDRRPLRGGGLRASSVTRTSSPGSVAERSPRRSPGRSPRRSPSGRRRPGSHRDRATGGVAPDGSRNLVTCCGPP